MKRSLILAFILLVFVTLLADEPVIIRDTNYLHYRGVNVQMTDGSIIAFWDETVSDKMDILAQRLDADGNLLWANPLQVVIKQHTQEVKSAVECSDGNVVILWLERDQNDFRSLWIQKISPNGDLLWNPNGIRVSMDEAYPSQFSIVPNALGGVYVMYYGGNTEGYLMGHNVNGNGIDLWTQNQIITLPNLSFAGMVEDGTGGVILNLQSYSMSLLQTHLMRLSAAGDVVGSNPLVQPSLLGQNGYKIIKSGVNDYCLVAVEENQLIMQKFNNSGDLLLISPAIYTLGTQYSSLSSSRTYAMSDGGIAFAYLPTSQSMASIRLQRFDTYLSPIWQEKVIASNIPFIHSFDIAGNLNGDVWVTWSCIPNQQSAYDSIVFARLVSENGAYATDAIPLSSSSNDKWYTKVVTSPSKASIFWLDFTGDRNSLRQQIVSNSGAALLPVDGASVRSILSGTCFMEETFSLGDRFVTIYYDTRWSPIAKIYYQVMDDSLTPLLEPNGRALTLDNINDETIICTANSGLGRFAILYKKPVNNAVHYYIQEIDNNGLKLYEGLGIELSIASINANPKISYDANSLYIFWSNLGFLKGQKIENGILHWETDGKLITTMPNIRLQLLAAHNRYVLLHLDNLSNGTSECRVLRINSDGNIAEGWNETGMLLQASSNSLFQQVLHSGVDDQDLVVFYINGSSIDLESRAQRISPMAERLWGEEALSYTSMGSLTVSVLDALYSDPLTFVYRHELENDLCLMQTSAAGVLNWEEGDALITSEVNYIGEVRLAGYNDGNISVFWVTQNDFLQSNLKHAYLSANGGFYSGYEEDLYSGDSQIRMLKTATSANTAVLCFNDLVVNHDQDSCEGVLYENISAFKLQSPGTANDDPSVEERVHLNQNYPNPFNPETKIDFQIMDGSFVTVDIYNLKGQRIRRLINEVKTQGKHSVIWNGTDENGKLVSSGVYLYRLQAGDFHTTRKMLMMK